MAVGDLLGEERNPSQRGVGSGKPQVGAVALGRELGGGGGGVGGTGGGAVGERAGGEGRAGGEEETEHGEEKRGERGVFGLGWVFLGVVGSGSPCGDGRTEHGWGWMGGSVEKRISLWFVLFAGRCENIIRICKIDNFVR